MLSRAPSACSNRAPPPRTSTGVHQGRVKRDSLRPICFWMGPGHVRDAVPIFALRRVSLVASIQPTKLSQVLNAVTTAALVVSGLLLLSVLYVEGELVRAFVLGAFCFSLTVAVREIGMTVTKFLHAMFDERRSLRI